MYKTFCENCFHFILKWSQPNIFGEVCFLEESYKNMQKTQILKKLRAPSSRHQEVCPLHLRLVINCSTTLWKIWCGMIISMEFDIPVISWGPAIFFIIIKKKKNCHSRFDNSTSHAGNDAACILRESIHYCFISSHE